MKVVIDQDRVFSSMPQIDPDIVLIDSYGGMKTDQTIIDIED